MLRVLLRHQFKNLSGSHADKLERNGNELRDLVVVASFDLLESRTELYSLVTVHEVTRDLRQRLIE
jgi:hypothetical protein